MTAIEPDTAPPRHDVVVDCGWGRLLFGQTFRDPQRLTEALRSERSGRRDICFDAPDPHVLLSTAPQDLFLDPSHTFRLGFDDYRAEAPGGAPVVVRAIEGPRDADAMNRIYAACSMVTAPVETIWANAQDPTFTYLVAEDPRSGEVVGTVTGVDHVHAFGDPSGATSLWCLAVAPQTPLPGVGEALVRALIERYRDRGRQSLDLSVLHDNTPAIALYDKLGFVRVPVFCVKRKNPINEPLFAPPREDDAYDQLNPYARIIADEARRRGIRVEVLDAEFGELRLSSGGRQVVTRESLSELTSAVAMSRCDDKRVTRRILAEAGLRVPRARDASGDESDAVFLAEVGEVVVKPARGEQGQGITVGVRDAEGLRRAVDRARGHCSDVLVEEYVAGEDLRVVVIDHEVVAAAVRRPASVIGTGRHTIRELVEAQSRRRQAATGGESRVPLDETTAETVRAAGYELDDVLEEGVELRVRRTANLHTGGTIHDVTADLHPQLAAAAVTASRALDVPVVGLDFLVPRVDGSDYVVIEANERPGLANHEPQPTASKFVDLLFPATSGTPQAWEPDGAPATTDHRPEPRRHAP